MVNAMAPSNSLLPPAWPSAEATIPVSYSRLMARELALQIRELPLLLAGTTLTVDRLLQEETLITADEQVQIWNNALLLSKDETFGLSLGRRLTPTTHGAIGFLANSSANLHTALQAVQVFVPTRVSFIRIELIENASWLECLIHFDIPLSPDLQRSAAETAVMVFMEASKTIVGQPLTGVEVEWPHSAPDYFQCYAEYLPGKQTFSASQLKVKVPLAVCYEPNVSANHEGYILALQQCESMLAQLRSDKQSYRYRIEKMMLSQPPGTLNEDEAAASLFMTKRTLARKLTAEGTGFRQLREEILSQQAASYLSDSQLSVETIAVLLNYFDAANFRRAFKRWFDVPPDKFRQQLHGQGSGRG